VTALATTTTPTTAAGPAQKCRAIRRGQPDWSCPEQATVEMLRTCHGEVRMSLVCARHGAKFATKVGRCPDCDTYTVVVLVLLPLGGAA